MGRSRRAHELLGDRRAAAVVAVDGVDGGGDEADRVEAGVVPERLVLDGRGGVDEGGRDLVEGDHRPAVVAELRELDLVAPVEHGRLGREVQLVERLLGILEVFREVRVPGDRRQCAARAQHEQGYEHEEGKRDRDNGDDAVPAAAALAA